MNEEEKKAYDYLEKYIEWETLGERNLEGDIKTILNLIEKQQEEIKELKAITRTYESYKIGEGDKIVIATKEYFNNGYFKENFISKDKIKAKIEKIKEDEEFYREQDRMYEFNGKINILKELLGE